MTAKTLLATLGVAGALLVGATTDASANPWQGRGPVFRGGVVYRAPIYRAPLYRPVVRVYRPAPVVYVPPAPIVYTAPVYPAPVVVAQPVVYRAPACATPAYPRPWVRHARW